MRPICIIPARGGSKRLPRKNILPLAGRPLLDHVVNAALSSGVFDQVIVSSDDEEILAVAASAGAVPYQRPCELGGDRATVVQVCLDVLKVYTPDKFCCIYATAALLSADTIRRSCRMFEQYSEEEASVLMGVSQYNFHPVQALKVDDDGSAKMMFQEYRGVQSQFYPEVRVSNGTLYWARASVFREERTFYSPKLKLIDVPEAEVCDVDAPEDYEELLRKFGG